MNDPWASWVGPFPWEQVDGETEHAYRAFAHYRDLGFRRSLREAAGLFYGVIVQEEGHTATASELRTFHGWSSDHEWVKRVRQFDHYEEVQDAKIRLEERREMERRHLGIANALQAKALQRLQNMNVLALGPSQLLRYLIEATKLERLTRGAATEITSRVGEAGGAIQVDLRPREIDVNRLAKLSAAMIEAGLLGNDEDDDDPDGD